MNVRFCKTCGAPLFQRDAYTWECNYCRNTYSDKSVRDESEALLRALLSESKIEQVANLRRNLYDAVSEKYTDSLKICRICERIKEYLPDDVMASFYYTANCSSPQEICDAISSIDAQSDLSLVEGIVSHVIKSMRSEYALPLQNLVERAYKGTDMSRFEEFSTLISNEMEKVNSGMYETAVPRDVFVAYSSADMREVEKLVYFLESNGLDCFVAARNLRHGRGARQNYEAAICEAIDNCRCVVFVSSANSRSMGCDALKVELKHIKTCDLLNAPAEHRRNYLTLPSRYKMNRVEYRIDNKVSQAYAEKVVSEFFSGLEYAYSPEEIVDRIYNFEDEIEEEPKKDTAPTKQVTFCPVCGSENPIGASVCNTCGNLLRDSSKICAFCGSENPLSSKFCNACGKNEFVSSRSEYELTKKLRELENRMNAQKPNDRIFSPEIPNSPPKDGFAGVFLTSCGSSVLKVIKVVREFSGLSLKDAKELVEKAPVRVASNISREDAERLASSIRQVGGYADVIFDPEAATGFSSAKREDPDKLYEDGCNYFYGKNGVAVDQTRAFEILSRAAALGHARALNFVGYCYELGKGVGKDREKCFLFYKKAAEQGLAVAQNNLGLCYEFEKGVAKDLSEAFKWYKKSAEQGYNDALNRVGLCYERGKGVQKDASEAVRWYRKAAENGYAVSQCNLGICYENGTGIQKDTAEAFRWYKKAAEQGNALAEKCLGTCFKYGIGTGKDLVEAVKWLKKAVDKGNSDAQNSLGICYERGEGVTKDLNEATRLYRLAADQGDRYAQYNLGNCYEYAKGVAKNMNEAFKWYKKSADQGYSYAQCSLGLCYEGGNGVQKNVYEAFKCYKASADQNYALAQKCLAVCYEYGIGTEKNIGEAFRYYKLAAEQGNAGAQNSLGVCYENGKATAKDINEAIKWYRLAADRGDRYGQYNLGSCYEYAKGVIKNMNEAFKWYKKAAEQGHASAQCSVGICYETGNGTAKDLSAAYQWYKKSADLGNKYALRNLGLCYEFGRGVAINYSTALSFYYKALEKGHESVNTDIERCRKK
ncbi:MAG: TIR domain-containing protein [Ruminococcaceae bacterium]|nr:TIR domain-containing protein [Oscillospiraceae bacterium]